MSEAEFNDLVSLFKAGDNSALAQLQPFQEACVRMLISKSEGSCSADDAYDIFIESMLDFRMNVLNDKVYYQNIPAYLKRMCWYKWLELHRKGERDEKHAYMVKAQIYPGADELHNKTTPEEVFSSRLSRVQSGMKSLSEQCQRILMMSMADEMPMAEIAQRLGFASADVAKTTKSRCYKKLLTIIRTTA